MHKLAGQFMDAVSVARNLLSNREREILVLVAQGFSNVEIGERLFIARTTVRTHLEHIYEKLCVHDRTEAVVKYFFSAESQIKIGGAVTRWRNRRNKK
jgi:ATP/maltotriose-dependent transcriptional regulator MalT